MRLQFGWQLLKMRTNDERRQEQVDKKIRMLADELDNALDGSLD